MEIQHKSSQRPFQRRSYRSSSQRKAHKLPRKSQSSSARNNTYHNSSTHKNQTQMNKILNSAQKEFQKASTTKELNEIRNRYYETLRRKHYLGSQLFRIDDMMHMYSEKKQRKQNLQKQRNEILLNAKDQFANATTRDELEKIHVNIARKAPIKYTTQLADLKNKKWDQLPRKQNKKAVQSIQQVQNIQPLQFQSVQIQQKPRKSRKSRKSRETSSSSQPWYSSSWLNWFKFW